MLQVIEELLNRFIEFILGFVSGTTIEEKLTSALRTLIFTASFLFWITLTLAGTTVSLRLEVNALQHGVKRVNVLFDPVNPDNPLADVIRLNTTLVNQIESASDEKELLIRGNADLINDNTRLMRTIEMNKVAMDNMVINLERCTKYPTE